MSEECCGGGAAAAGHEEVGEATSFWRGRTAQVAAASGVLLGAGLVASAAGAHSVGLGLDAAALCVGGWTFVPG